MNTEAVCYWSDLSILCDGSTTAVDRPNSAILQTDISETNSTICFIFGDISALSRFSGGLASLPLTAQAIQICYGMCTVFSTGQSVRPELGRGRTTLYHPVRSFFQTYPATHSQGLGPHRPPGEMYHTSHHFAVPRSPRQSPYSLLLKVTRDHSLLTSSSINSGHNLTEFYSTTVCSITS